MNRLTGLTIMLMLTLSSTCLAQQVSDIHQHTTPPPGARFEIIQSELAAKWTFRLDRFTGHVGQLVRTSDGDDAWEDMSVTGLAHVTTPMRPRFQLFASGLAAKFIFLIDTDTGKTWVLVADQGDKNADGTESEVLSWQPFSE